MPPRNFGSNPGWRYDPLTNTYAVQGYFPEYETIVRGKRKYNFPRDRMSLSDKAMMHYQGMDYSRKILNANRTDLFARSDTTRRLENNLGPGFGGSTGAEIGINWLKRIRGSRRIDRGFLVEYTGSGMLGAVPQNATPFGRKVLSNLSTWKQQQFKLIPPVRNLGGSCWQVTLDRMKKAYQAVYSKGIFQGVNKENQLLFEAIAGSRRKEDPWTGYDWSKHWKVVPKSLQYRGVPGALEHLGLGKVVEGENVWKGNISPGSPLQLWYGMGKIGHSAIMERYIHGKNGEIIGLVYSDQWLDYKVVLKKGDQKIIGFHFRR